MFRQNGTGKPKYQGQVCKKIYYKLRIGHGDSAEAYTLNFSRRVFLCLSVPNRVLVWYVGDESLAVLLCHGNATKPTSKEGKLLPSSPSTKDTIYSEAKTTCDPPLIHHAKLFSGEEPQEYPRDLIQEDAATSRCSIRVSRDVLRLGICK